ncbi:hypothetical protein A8B82_14860 [Sulfitobacter sp. EhC04]|uniref:hypothetical protein n=1 Tax=Sulfitobacter sp. EhC04 TaxID=1849168 RepID=UPI0007F3DF8F|nr:hypothetical protein [Sulfitobacter sp. EhC04]OAN76677.1 hypothetical protein A8B82_14860 [Sulfitobacter sp. EhC04]
MSDLPERALSIRQPWVWAILNAGKRIENRPRRFNYRGPICLHASLYEPKAIDYESVLHVLRVKHGDHGERQITREDGNIASMHHSNEGRARGGIIGTADIVDCIETSDEPWFFGPYGLVLENIQPVPFIPVKGALGLFRWKERT